MPRSWFLFGLFSLLIAQWACRSTQATTYDFPKPVDTTTRSVTQQVKQVYQPSGAGLMVDNRFDGARLNDFVAIGRDSFRAVIRPENEPINPSAYYAFRLWSDAPKEVVVELDYATAFHRYPPKISRNGEVWELLDTNAVRLAADSVNAFLTLNVSPETLYVAAQELHTTHRVRDWCDTMARHPNVRFQTIGQSRLERPLYLLDIGQPPYRRTETIVILSRQHPPEVTGYLAMRAFVEALLADTPLANAFRKKYRTLVYPLLNPDGVDLGHWRHNAGGIDLNRDWAYYHQPETRAVANDIVRRVREARSDVLLGIDFHSTWYDILYTNSQAAPNLPGFKDYWIQGFRQDLDELEIVERPSVVGAPVSKGWLLTQLGAEGITYEVGDNTPRDLIRRKGRSAAVELMELLVLR